MLVHWSWNISTIYLRDFEIDLTIYVRFSLLHNVNKTIVWPTKMNEYLCNFPARIANICSFFTYWIILKTTSTKQKIGFWWMLLDIRHQFMKYINLVIHSCRFILDVNHCVVSEENTEILQWRHNERDGVSNHQPHECLLNRLFKAQIKENIKAPRHWPLWEEFIDVHRWPTNSPHKKAVTRKIFHLMTPSWYSNDIYYRLIGHKAISKYQKTPYTKHLQYCIIYCHEMRHYEFDEMLFCTHRGKHLSLFLFGRLCSSLSSFDMDLLGRRSSSISIRRVNDTTRIYWKDDMKNVWWNKCWHRCVNAREA